MAIVDTRHATVGVAALYPCCADPSNRVLVSLRTVDDALALRQKPWIVQQFVRWGWLRHPQMPHARHERCGVCGRNHYRAHVGRPALQPGRVSIS